MFPILTDYILTNCIVESIKNALLQGQTIDWFLLLLFLLLFLVHLVNVFLFSLRVALHKNPPAGKQFPLSVLFTFRNEEKQLADNLPSLLKNGHSEFEVVAVDNCSLDESLTVLNSLKSEHNQLRISSLRQHTLYSGKMAQNIALKAASYDWVTFIPISVNLADSDWLKEVSSRINGKNQVVVNYSNIQPGRSFFNLLYRVEYFFQQLKSFGFILNGSSFVLTQENVTFKKQQYFDEGGYRGKVTEPFANLELVINSFIRKVPVSIVISAETALHRKENVNYKDYLELVKKEAVLRKHLPPGQRILLVLLEWAFLLFAPVGIFVVFRMPPLWPVVIGLFICLISCHLLIIKRLLIRLKEFKLFLPSLLTALILPFLKIIFRIWYFRYGLKREWRIGN